MIEELNELDLSKDKLDLKPPKVKEFSISEGSKAVIIAKGDYPEFKWYDCDNNFLGFGSTYITPHLFNTTNYYVCGVIDGMLSDRTVATIRVNPWQELLLNLGSKEINGDDYTVVMRIFKEKFIIKQIFLEETPYLSNHDDDEITYEFDYPDALKEYHKDELQFLRYCSKMVKELNIEEIFAESIKKYALLIKNKNA